MSNPNETTEEAIAALRRYADFVQKHSGEITVGHDALRELADRIEAVYKREIDEARKARDEARETAEDALWELAELRERAPGNAAALREALENVERVARFCAEMPRHTPGYPTDAARADVLYSRIAELGRVARAALSVRPEPPSNAAAMRAALLSAARTMEIESRIICTEKGKIGKFGNTLSELCKGCRARNCECWQMTLKREVESALAAPARNCDVGTAEEQAHRFQVFCSDNTSEIEGMCNSTCPCIDCGDKCHCLCVWSQMPFAPAAERKGENK